MQDNVPNDGRPTLVHLTCCSCCRSVSCSSTIRRWSLSPSKDLSDDMEQRNKMQMGSLLVAGFIKELGLCSNTRKAERTWFPPLLPPSCSPSVRGFVSYESAFYWRHHTDSCCNSQYPSKMQNISRNAERTRIRGIKLHLITFRNQ
jgi:hypothetical protein